MLEPKPMEVQRTLVETNVICEFDGRRHLEHYWDSHGKLVPFDTHKNCYKNGHFKVVEIVEDVSCFGGEPVRFSRWDLYFNGEKIATDVYEVLKSKIKIVVGWG